MPNPIVGLAAAMVVITSNTYATYYHSYLVVGTSSSLGSPCYSDSRDADIKLLKCFDSPWIEDDVGSLPDCPQDLYGTSVTGCKIGYDDTYSFAYVCTWSDGPEYACTNCGWQDTTVWTGDYFDGSVIIEDIVHHRLPSTPKAYACEMTEEWDVRYSCPENQYLIEDTVVCETCPSTGVSDGTSEYGTALVTDCYAKEGSDFKDATGSGKFMGDCYYKL